MKDRKSFVSGEVPADSVDESSSQSDATFNSVTWNRPSSNVDSAYYGLLDYFRRRHYFRQPPLLKKLVTVNCQPQDVYVNYVYKYDIHNQVFNSSFQDPNSVVIQSLQSDIAHLTAEELYKRNLVSYVSDEAHLIRIMDVSGEYNDMATLRFYVSIDVSRSLVPIMRHIFATVFKKLQNDRFATSNKKVDWGDMVLIPITK